MKVTESELQVRTGGIECPIDLIHTLGAAANLHAGANKQVVRFVMTGEAEGLSTCELGVFEEPREDSTPDLFHSRQPSGRNDPTSLRHSRGLAGQWLAQGHTFENPEVQLAMQSPRADA
jgi:hypothetical protein